MSMVYLIRPLKQFVMLVALSCVTLPTMAFEPLNTDDAATIGKNVNQIEQYFYVLHNNVAGNPGGTAPPVKNLEALGMQRHFRLLILMA